MKRGKPQQTFYVIAYDIPDDRRRTKVHNTLCGFGKWTQYSLFECYLTQKELITLQGKLEKILRSEEDSVRFYSLCETCLGKVVTIGSEKPSEQDVFVV